MTTTANNTTVTTAAKLTAATICKTVKDVHAKTPARTRATLETYRALFVNLRGMNYEGANNQNKTIKNTTGAELEMIKAQLDNISAAFSTLVIKGHESYLGKVSGLMKNNINNNARFELARKEAQKEALKTAEAKTA
jgi:hypothetical protein